MATDTQRQNGYWRINPDGTRDWIETNAPLPQPAAEEQEIAVAEEPAPAIDESPLISPAEFRQVDVAWDEWSEFFNRTGQFPDTPADQDLAPLFESWKSVVQQWQLEHPEIEVGPQEVAGMPPMPDVNPLELATVFGVDVVRFFGPVQLADLALPREERTLNWQAPFEQFLTWEQAQWLGIQGVPEGGVVRVTPMADGTLSYALVPGPGDPGFAPAVQAEVDERREELLTALRLVFPEEFDPAMSFGISPENLPEAVLQGFRNNLATDYERTVAELFERAGPEQGETILRMMGVTEENVLRTLDFKEQEARVDTMIDAVFADHDLEDLAGLVETDWPLFVETMRWKGITAEKQALLQYMGYSPQEIGEFFSIVTVPATVNGFEKILTVDVASMRAFDEQGNWAGTYNVVTQEFAALPEEDWLKDVWDGFVLGGQNLLHDAKQFLFSALPNFLFRDLTEAERSIYGDEYVNRVNAVNAVQRDKFRSEYSRNERLNEEWITSHPELVPPEWTKGNIGDRLREDPLRTILYEFATTAPFAIAVFGTQIAVTLTTGNPVLGTLAAMTVATPPQAQQAHDALLAAGASEQQAGLMALPIGVLMAGIESVGNLVPLKLMFPNAFKLFTKEIVKELSERTLASMAKKGLLAFAAIDIIEGLEEVAQAAVLNAGIKVFDENQELFEDWDETMLQAMVAALPFAAFGGAFTALQRVSPGDYNKLTDEQRQEQGLQQDPGTGNWYKPMELPAPVIEATGVTPEGGALAIEQRLEALPPAIDVKPAFAMTSDEFTTFAATGQFQEGTAPFIEAEAEVQKGEAIDASAIEWGEAAGFSPEDMAAFYISRTPETGYQQYIGDSIKLGRDVPDTIIEEVFPVETQAQWKRLRDTTPEKGRRLPETTPDDTIIPSNYSEAVPPPPPTATGRVAQQIQFNPPERNLKEKIRHGWHKFNVKVVDDLFAMKRLTDRLRKSGVELSIAENPYLLARLLRGVTSKATTFLEKGTFGRTFWKVGPDGKATPDFTGEALETILKEVRQPQKWQDFSIYLTARRAVQLSARDIETGMDAVDARDSIRELEEANPGFAALADRVYRYQDSLLVYANEMSLISDDLLTKLREFGDYVPFYRVMNELQAKGLFGKKMANIASPIKRIRGSELEIINPLESIVKNTYVLISAADRNMVGVALANMVDQNPEIAEVFERVKTPIARVARISAKDLGVEVEGMTEAEEEQLVDIFRPSFFVRGDEVTVLVNGKKQYYRVDPDLRDAMLSLNRDTLGMLGKILSYPTKWLRAGATLSPDFMVRNPLRDQMTAFAYSNYGFLPGIDFLKGVAEIFRKGDAYNLFHLSGAAHSMMVSLDRQYLQKTFRQVVEGKGFTDYIKHPLELFQILSELGEKATRMGEFMRGLDRGAVPLEAGYSARSVTLDFAQGGTTALALNQLIAFFNANIRGWGRMISSFKEHPARTSLKVFAGITLPSLLLYYANRDDPRWKEIAQWQKDLFWIVFIKPLPAEWESWSAEQKSEYINSDSGRSGIIRIPKPFELGIIFGSAPERFLEYLDTGDPDMLGDMLANLAEAGFPGVIPTAALPIIENYTNFSFFRGRDIVPPSRQDMPPELQYTRWTSPLAVWLGDIINFSPAKIDNLIFGYTGGLGRYAVDSLTPILRATGISPDIPEPDPTLADIPVLKAFVVRHPYGSSGETVNDFYKVLEEHESGERFLKEMLELGNEGKFDTFKAAHPELLFFYDAENDVAYSATARYLRTVARELSELRKKQDEVFNDPDMDGAQKRRLVDEIDFVKTDVARRALDLFFGDVPDVLQTRLSGAIDLLGTVIDDVPELSLEKPDIYDMGNLNTEYTRLLEAVTAEDLRKLTDPEADPLAYHFLEKEEVETEVDPILNRKVYTISPDLKEGVTFADYYESWRQGLVTDADLDGLTRRQAELLVDYHAIDDPAARRKFREDHPELSVNPRHEWLKAHPEENAKLAVWGQEKIYSLEAYNAFNRMVEELDIPDAGIPIFLLPPQESIETHFKYEDFVAEGAHASWEAQLLLLEDHMEATEAKRESYIEWRDMQLPETPHAALTLKVDNRGLYDALEEAREIDDEEEREAATEAVKLTTVEGDTQFRDILRQVEAIEQGSATSPISDELVGWHVDYGRAIDEFAASSPEAMLFRVDHQGYDDFRRNEELWGNQALEAVNEYRIPIWRIDVQYKAEDEAYNALPVEGDDRAVYLAGNLEYRQARRTREAFELLGPDGQRFPQDLIPTFVQYYELPAKGKRQERFLVDNPVFATAMHEIKGIDIPAAEDVPAVQYDDIYDEFRPAFERLEGFPDFTSEHYIEDTDRRAEAVRAMRFDENGHYSEFGLAEVRRNAYGAFVPEQHIEAFVGYYKIIGEGKPENWKLNVGTDLWYDDDWFLIENLGFYEEVYVDLKGNERLDFSKVPSREVFTQYLAYLQLPTLFAKDAFRWENRELDAWLVLKFEYTPVEEKRRRSEMTTLERFQVEWDERQKKIEEALRKLRGEGVSP